MSVGINSVREILVRVPALLREPDMGDFIEGTNAMGDLPSFLGSSFLSDALLHSLLLYATSLSPEWVTYMIDLPTRNISVIASMYAHVHSSLNSNMLYLSCYTARISDLAQYSRKTHKSVMTAAHGIVNLVRWEGRELFWNQSKHSSSWCISRKKLQHTIHALLECSSPLSI